MKLNIKMEVVLIVITAVLCLILVLKILNRLRSNIPWRVNCWFCNSNFWVKYPEHNCWTCPKCEQYNGFTEDGDYNKTLITANEQVLKSPKVFSRSPPKNGLCKMCNINQQLKVAQLANYVPMNDMNFNEEIEGYKTQVEKAYKLCSPCRKVLQLKLHKEKEILLGTKLLESRIPDTKHQKRAKQTRAFRSIINNTSMLFTTILFILVSCELYNEGTTYESLPKTLINIIDIMKELLYRVFSILKMKIFTTFPSIETFVDLYYVHYIDMMPKTIRLEGLDYGNKTMQVVLGGVVCLIQIVAYLKNVNTLRYTVAVHLLWTVFMLSMANFTEAVSPILISVIKIASVITLLVVYKNMGKPGRVTTKSHDSSKLMKSYANSSSSLAGCENTTAMESDDDVSLSKFGLHNLTGSSNEAASPLNTSLINGRSFTPRSNGLWTKVTKPKVNSTFCVNSVLCKSPSSISDTVFAKPSFTKYQKLANDSDSELDESINSLCIGSPTKSKKKGHSIFSLRKFTASPNFVMPAAINYARPLISPSKLGYSTSWVAGGYWGADSDRKNIFIVDGSRTSSQSSGFESQTSSMNQRNMFSQPPSREESVCGEPMVLDRFPNMSNLSSYNTPQNFSRISSPVFPQMVNNGHIHIPQARFAQTPTPHSMFMQHNPYAQNGLFKTPGVSGLIKLPPNNSFTND